MLQKFILTVGVVSNHGNWFTAEDHNKELKVLAQSYDWLMFINKNAYIQVAFVGENFCHSAWVGFSLAVR